MGCDIHLYTEKKVETRDGHYAWFCCDSFMYGKGYQKDNLVHISIYSTRNYMMFGILANVRNHKYEPVVASRGLPNDVSDVIKEAAIYWGDDGHTHTWLTANEVFQYYKKNKNNEYIKVCMRPLVKAIKKKMCNEFYINTNDKEIKKNELKKHGDDFRIVFWFDN